MIWSACSKLVLVMGLLAGWALAAPVQAAETSSSPGMAKTQLVVKLATPEAPSVRPRFEKDPPTIVLEFPQSRVTGALPERSVIARGAIQEIQTLYASSGASVEGRWIQALRIQLRGPYVYEIRPEPGRIIVEIMHPASLGGEALEVGLAGGIVVSGMFSPVFSERFRAMQEALARAQPQPVMSRAGPLTPRLTGAVTPPPPRSESSSGSSASAPRSRRSERPSSSPSGWWTLGGAGVLGLGGLIWRWRRRRRLSRAAAGEPLVPVPASIRIIDQLVWRVFERQGYQLIQMVELGEPLGLMRLMSREGRKAALLCMGNGAFFEKTAVEQFIQASRRAQAEHGFLVTPGSFTIPAQRVAKEHEILLIGREQLIELLSEGAMSEVYAKQLYQLRAKLEEAKQTLSQYAAQLDTIRRQRNEASWFLGEERANHAKLEAQAGELTQLVAHWQAQADQWQQAEDAAKKQWEESQWYLGEAQASLEHLDGRIRRLEEAAAKLQQAERERDEANWYLGEAHAALEALQQESQQLRDHLAQSQQTLEDLQRRLDAERAHRQIVETQLAAVSSNGGERRQHARLFRADIAVEAHRDDGEVVFRGISRDLSLTGIGFVGADEPPADLPDPLRLRLHIPGAERPLEATGRLIWHRRDVASGRTASGCEWLKIPAEFREALERTLTTTS